MADQFAFLHEWEEDAYGCGLKCVRRATALLNLASFQLGPSASALSKITARRNYSDLPVSSVTVASQIARSSSVSRTIYLLLTATSVWMRTVLKIDGLGNPKIQPGRGTRPKPSARYVHPAPGHDDRVGPTIVPQKLQFGHGTKAVETRSV